MGMTRGTALVATVARVVQLTGVLDLANLESDSELTLTDLLTTASDAIFDRLEADGIDPTALSNQTRFERAVAWEFLSILYSGGLLRAGADEPVGEAFARSRLNVDRYYDQVRPATSGDDPARPTGGIPLTLNFEPGHAFGPDPGAQSVVERLWDDLPTIR